MRLLTMKNTLVSVVVFFFIVSNAFGQAAYVDSTFQYFDFKTPTSKTEWLERRIEIRRTIKQIFGKIPDLPK